MKHIYITITIIALLMSMLMGCQTHSSKKYYDPPQFHPKTGEPMVLEEESKTGASNWSDNKTFNFNGAKL